MRAECVEVITPLAILKMVAGYKGRFVSPEPEGDKSVQRIRSADNIAEVMERIVGRGIVVDPWVTVCLSEPDRLRRYRWVADCRVSVGGACELKKIA